MFRPWYGDKMSKNNQKWTSVRSWDVCYKWTKMKVGAQCFDLDMVITWPNMTKNKLRCEAEMRYQWTKMYLDAKCFEFDMVTKWPNMNCGAKLRCTKNEQEWPSVRNLANSMLWQNDPKWTSVRSWDALKMIKITLGAQCFVFDVVSKMTQNEHRCEVKCILLKQRLQSSKN